MSLTDTKRLDVESNGGKGRPERKDSSARLTRGQVFSGSLTFLSILLGIFTFSLVNAIKLRGTYPEAYPWYSLTWITGVSILLSGLICSISLLYHDKLEAGGLTVLVTILFFIMLVICGVGVPLIGLWLFFSQ